MTRFRSVVFLCIALASTLACTGCSSSQTADPGATAEQVDFRVTVVGIRADRARGGSFQRLQELARETSATAGRQRTEASLRDAIDRLDTQGAIVMLVQPRVHKRDGARSTFHFDHRGDDSEFEVRARGTRVDADTLQVAIDASLQTKGAATTATWGDIQASSARLGFVPVTLRPAIDDLDGKRLAISGGRVTEPDDVHFYVFVSLN